MKNISLAILLLLLIASACNNAGRKPASTEAAKPEFSSELSDSEKTGGVMTPEIMWKFTKLGPFALSPDGSAVVYSTTRTDLQSETRITNLYSVSLSGGEPVLLATDGATSPQWFANGSKIAFVRKGVLFTMNPDGTEQKEVSGLSEFESYSISPASDMIYFTRRVKLDQTPNEKHSMPKAKVRIIDDLMYRHWNSWPDYSYSHIFIARFDGNSVTDAKDIMENQRFESPTAPYYDEAEISWSPDGKMIAYTTKRATGKADAVSTNTDIFLYDLAASTEKNITAGNPGYDKYPVFSPDGSKIAFQSMKRDGYEADLDRLFVYSIAEGTARHAAPSWDYDVESINWASDKNIFFVSSYRGTAQLFTVNTDEGNVTKVTEGKHNLGQLSLKSGKALMSLSSMAMAPELCKVNLSDGSVTQVTNMNKYIYDFIKLGKSEERFTRTTDGKELQSWVIYPPDFDPSKKYPLLLFCKGGPQGPLDQGWSYRWNYQMMAAKGYIVVAPNRRGNSGFGQEWKEQISGDYGGKNIQDYLDATDDMAKEPYVDASKMGAVGASYGGYSVFYLAGVHNKRFKAFISHCGMFNFESWYGTTEELWFPNFDFGGPYWDKSVTSYKFSPHRMVEKWDTPILIITGQNDFRIPYTQSMEAFQAAQLRGIPSKLLFFEDETHFVLRPQNSVIWQREFFSWLETYLK